MFSRAELLPTPFPTRSFVALGTAWVLLDLAVMGGLWFGSWRWQGLELVAISWQAILAAKAMLMLGWWFLGEGRLGDRLAGIFLFSPVFVPMAFAALFEPQLLCVLATVATFSVPVLFMVGLPYFLLYATDHRLARDVPPSQEKVGQFTVRQLMLVTLVAAVVLGLLRWAQQSNMSWAVIGLQIPLLIWVLPFVMCRGVLQPRWYPEVLFAVGVAAYVLALPSFVLSNDDVGPVALFVSTYVAIFTGHLLLLRGLGFRLVTQDPHLRRDAGIWFIDQREPGITFLEPNVSRDRASGARSAKG